MEASVETAEVNNVESASEVGVKETPDEIVKSQDTQEAIDDVSSIPEPPQPEKSNVSDKELSWEKIAAEFTEDEEEDVKPEELPQETSVAPEIEVRSETVQNDSLEETVQNETVQETEVVEETVIVDKSVTNSDSSENIVESVTLITEEHVDEVIEEPPKEEVEEVVDTDSIKTNESVTEVLEIIEDDSSKEPAIPVEEPAEEPPKTATESVVEYENHAEEIIDITELKPDEATPIEETVDELEYTVVEAEEVETNEIIEEHLAQTHPTETVVIINPDQSQTEITIEQVDESEKTDDECQYIPTNDAEAAVDDPVEEVKEVKPKKQRGRKPISDIPLHVLGRDITKPTEGVSNGGRTMPKPRLGVKVPYRNLTSQIVSKEEIEKEIMDRFKLKQEQNATSSGDILFARKLTQRLAKKLIPAEREKTAKSPEVTTQEPTEAEIKNNSDLIAILEGEDEEIPMAKPQEVSEQPRETMSKNTEREIALQQLSELPVSKSKFYNEEEKKPPQPVKTPIKAAPVEATPVKNPIEKKSQSDMEPRIKAGMVIKTYTRKRKSSDLETILPPKKSVVVATTIKSEDGPPTNVYITKSSRIIKRKVIWDPDEIPSKSPIKSPKPEPTAVKSPVKSPKPEAPVEKSAEKKILAPVKKVISKTPPPKKLKRLTEVDKLLMDEGAVNMLYDVKTNDDATQDKLKKKNNNKSMISLDKAHKELMSKTNVIKNDLQQNTNKDNQKSLRKKEVATPSPPKKEAPSPKKEAAQMVSTRKKSKDSAKSSVHSPPSSPPYNAAEASRIIRRHSSSSFSSTDGGNEENGEEKATRKKSVQLESPKKKMKKSHEAKPTKDKEAAKNNNTVSDAKDKNQYKSFTMSRKNKLVSIKLGKVNGKHYFTDQVLKDLTGCLKELGKEDECHVVSLTSDSNDSFCHGLDYRFLVSDDENVRKKKATELSNLVKDFLRCLLNFPKVLVAGIQGDCVGLGVTMLPLFDMVIASDTSTFSTPYAQLGCVPEAGFLLTVPYLGSHGLANELLYTSQVIKADDAFRRGLVTRLCWPEKYHEELKGMLSQIANQSQATIMATKQQLRLHILQTTESSLNTAIKALVDHWTSPECQSNFSK